MFPLLGLVIKKLTVFFSSVPAIRASLSGFSEFCSRYEDTFIDIPYSQYYLDEKEKKQIT